MAVLGAIAAGGAELMKAHEIEKAKTREAAALIEAKNRVMGATTRDMEEQGREKEHMQSRAVALAAAGGGGVDDPTIVKILGDLNAEGLYRIFSTLWTGQNQAEGLMHRANEATREAKAARSAGIINAFTAGASAYAYGGGAFASTATTLPSTPAAGSAPAASSSGGLK
jgi:hypothetical protein